MGGEPDRAPGCGDDAGRPAHGHRTVPHTADVRLEAWAPGREQCLVEAVLALVESFADVTGVRPTGVHRVRVEPAADDDLLAALLDEVVYRLDVTGEVPVDVSVEDVDGGLDVRLSVAAATDVPMVGAAPKAVALQQLRLAPGPCGWTAGATVDV